MMDDEEAIAVVGVGCRFPGADTAEEFWRVLVNSENHVKDIPKDRWNNEAFFNEDKDAVGKSYVSKAGLLKDHDMWDNKLFGVSDVEAARIDPQQRYVLECVHMAMEDGGFTRAKMSGTKTGVYIGCMNDDYKIMSSQDPSGTTNYSATGTSTTVISARVSYVFNLHGPCLTVDTACSSAMMAIHLGCQAIRSGDCCQAICGGVSSIMYPDMFIPLSKARMMSTVGRCQTFCDTADGYARGEGCGVVILKPLKQALRDSDKVWGVIVTGTNQDGRASQPMTAPSGNQQQALLKHVYTKYDIDPSTVQYIEAHGTGTHIGDPTETNALGSFFSKFRGQKPNPLLIGSVKTNIGHTESAAGVAGLIKVLLMMKEGKFVPSLHIQRDKKNVNKEIDLGKHNIDIPVEVSEWKVNVKGQRIACINSFGFGGSNCHAVVKSAAKLENYEFNEVLIPLLFGISGIDKNSLQNNLVSFIKNISEKKVNLPAASYTSLLRRDHFKYRTIIAGSTIVEVKNNARVKLTMTPKTRKYTNNNIVFVFSGVGTTWPGMCCQFMTNQTFRKTIKEIDDCLQPLTDLILSGLFTSQETKYDDPFLNHVAIFAVQVALARVWIGFDVEPNAIIGQSVGEVAAAHISGRIPLAEAVRIIVHRSKILAEHIGGSMMVVKGVNLKRVELICSEHSNTSIAVYSSPVGCTLSGESSEIESIKETLQEHSETEALNTVLIRKLNVASAYHSPLVDCCKKEITDAIGKIEHINNFKYKIISTVTANDASDTDFTTGEYWAKNVRKSVLLYQSVKRAASNTKYNIFLEIGPKPVLKAHLPDIFEDREFSCQQSMNLNKELPCMFDTLSELFQNGVEINWTNLFDEKMIPTSIPKYVFQKSKTLHLSEKIKHHLAGLKPDENTSHMFIKSVLHGKESEFEICLSVSTTNFVFDHRMSGTVLVPGATYIDAALFVGTNVLGKSVHSLSVSVEFVNPVILQQNEESSIVVSTDIEKGTVAHFRCRNKTGFVVAKGKVFPRQTIETKQVHIQELKNKCRKEKDKGSVYSTLRDLQFEYGPSLAMIEHSWCSGAECISEIFIPDSIASEIQKTIIHPAIVDAMFQTFSNFIDEKPDVVLPKGCETITLFGQIDPEERTLYVYVKLISQTANEFHFNLVLLNPTGIVLLEILDFYAHTLEKSINVKQTYVDQKMAVEISRKTQQRQVILFSTKSLVHETWFSEFVGLHRMCCIEDIDTEHENRLKAAATLFYSKQPVQTHDSISASAVNECLRFREFLCLYHKNDLKCPIYIITENTQDHLNKAKACVTVEGSYLWGMIRALRHEQDHLDLRLVDVDKNNLNVETLSSIFSTRDITNAELIVSGTSVHHVNISRVQLNTIGRKRDITKDFESSASLLSTCHKNVQKPFIADRKLSGLQEQSKTMAEIAITSMCLHPLTTFVQTIGVDIQEIWPDTDLESNTVIALEGRGFLKDSHKQNIEMGFLYPVPVQYPTVRIPKECTWSLSKCSPIPGVLLNAELIRKSIQNIPNGSHVLLIGNSTMNEHIIKQVFELFGAPKSYTFSFVEKDNIKKEQCNQVGLTIVPLVKMSSNNIDRLIKVCRSTTGIVAFLGNVSSNLQAYIQMTYPTLTLVVISPAEVFNPQNLCNSVQQTLEQISRNGLESNKEIASLFQTSVMQTMNIYSDSNIHHKVDSLGLFRKSGCYIVVGGLTGLGRLLVKYIAELGAGQIAIFSRRQPDDEQKSNLKDFETRFSTTIRTFQVDVTELSSINLARERLCVALKGIPIRGVFQGAGVLADGLYETQTAETFMKVLKPKLDGTWNLHLCFQDLHLDYFVMHSSVTSLLGNRGQTNYAAANSFLDSMALYRRSLGMSGQAINWGALAIGMAEDDKIANRLQHQGIGILSEERTKTYFTDALLSNVPNICFADLKWDVLSRSSAVKKQKNKFSGLFRSGMAETEKGQQQKENINLHELQGLAIQAKRSDVRNIILTLIGKQFIIDIITLKDNQNFVELGIDSLSAVGFVNDLRTVFSVPYPLVNLISGTTTIGTVVDFYCECSKKAETKINNHTENDLEESKRQAAVTQIPELIGYFRSNVDPGLTYMTDIEIKGMTLTHADFRSFVVHVLTRFRELRCHIKHDGLETFVVTEDDANDVSDKIPIEIFPFKEMVEKFNTAQDQRGTVTFDLENQYPIKFQIGETNSCLCIRVCVHKAVSDMTSIVLIFKEMKTFFESSLRNKQNNAHVHEVYPRKAINEAVRERRKDGLKYWRQRIAFASPCSLAKPMSEPQANFFKSTSKALGPNIYNQIMEFLRDSDATLFQLFASVYQLLLSVETGQPNVTILTDVNLRAEIPAIAGEVVRGINVIPLSVQPSKQMTFKEFLGENKKQILADIEHGSFPYLDIVNILQPEIKANIGRHYLIMNDMTQFDILTGGPQDQSYTISIKNFWIAKMSKETICQVEYNTNTKNITIHFHYNELICGAESGRNLGERLFQILHHGINNGQQTIEALFHKEARSKYIGRLQHHEPLDTCIHEMATEISTLASPNNYRLYPSLPQKKKNLHTLEIMNGYFQKQTKAGWSHRVYVTLLEHQDNDNDAKWMTIQWSKKPGRPTKSLSVSNCDSICMLKLNGQHSIVVQTPERQLVIHTPDHEVANRWMTVFENSSFIPSIVNAKND
ncbi:phthioceranic/hydroxyphthioceranic acid synthase-like [Mya arenaria]|uniref:phthioceranic/hydroxyphthioceranic acid synthase-like n=1 Tax=Mya arenaria TaxID=6604 RepID=UPI0022E463AA|nr:phthioceranic/hydroxyphthioceranic acid synthase-like [Mya arenaria]